MVVAHGTAEEMARAKAVLGTTGPKSVDLHAGVVAVAA